nr:hypothetical protein [Aliiglaciecola lipolytica]
MQIRQTIIASLFVSFGVSATPTLVDTSQWQADESPSTSRLSKNDVWVGLESNAPRKNGNSSGSLISDFVSIGDFVFSGSMTPTFANNLSCEAENTCNDNDILGIVFGWQDSSNHYRLGFSQGDNSTAQAVSDITGRNGLFLIREVNGSSSTLAHWSNVFWQDEQTYNFSVGRLGDEISFSLNGMGLDTAQNQSGALPSDSVFQTQNAGMTAVDISYNLLDSTFLGGRVGVYTESQTAIFSGLTFDNLIKVSAPPVFATALIALIWSVRRKNKKLTAQTMAIS